VRVVLFGNVFRAARGKNLTAFFATLRTEIYEPVGSFNDIEIVLDDDDGVALVAESMQYDQQLLNVMKVQTGGGFIENIEGAASAALGEFPRQFDALRLAA
jgi:hypothetical protein